MLGRPSRLVVAVTAALILAACDIGDGTTLREPVAETTIPPPETTPLETAPLDDPALENVPPVESVAVPIDTSDLVDPPAPTPGGGDSAGLQVTTPWVDGATIDRLYTCDGANASPEISWSGVPDGTQELAISLVDESNISSGRPFIHWVLTGLDPSIERIGENEVPPGAVRGLNFFGDIGYTGPCPDPGTTGTYSLTVFALDQQLELPDGTPAAQLLDVVGTVSIGSTSSTGLVAR